MKNHSQINIRSYKAKGFIGNYQKLIRETVIPYQYSVLCDEAPDTEKSHVVQNFINAGKAVRGEDVGDGFYGMVFQDSDAAKWLEAVAYSLSLMPDNELEATADKLIDVIADAQDTDGYLNTYFTIKDKEKRWTNLLEGHELYCSGHMMEAACAYFEATGKRKLLDVMEKNAEHIYNRFITEKHDGFPGHPEVELALMKMYRCTGNKKCLELAEHFVNTRGCDPDFYKKKRQHVTGLYGATMPRTITISRAVRLSASKRMPQVIPYVRFIFIQAWLTLRQKQMTRSFLVPAALSGTALQSAECISQAASVQP